DAEGEEYDPAQDPFREYNMHITDQPSQRGELDAEGELYDEAEERNLYELAAKNSVLTKKSQSMATMDSQSSYFVTKEELSNNFDRKKLFNRMLNANVKAATGPWHINGEWSTEVLQMMVDYMRTREKLSVMSRKKVNGKKLKRNELVKEMDRLWKWAEDNLMGSHKKKAVDKAQVLLRKIESGELNVKDIELIRALLSSVPLYSPSDPSKMPWHDGPDNVYRWTQNLKIDYVKKVLRHIWPSVIGQYAAREKQKLLDNGSTKELLNAMDEAWGPWLERKARLAKADAARYQKIKDEERQKLRSVEKVV
ncbi:hypothetical protein H0H93_012187, partial [Arthromyces matolae]